MKFLGIVVPFYFLKIMFYKRNFEILCDSVLNWDYKNIFYFLLPIMLPQPYRFNIPYPALQVTIFPRMYFLCCLVK